MRKALDARRARLLEELTQWDSTLWQRNERDVSTGLSLGFRKLVFLNLNELEIKGHPLLLLHPSRDVRVNNHSNYLTSLCSAWKVAQGNKHGIVVETRCGAGPALRKMKSEQALN